MTSSIPYAVPENTGQFAEDFLFEIGAPETASNIGYVEAWENVESPSGYGYNPLGTEEQEPGSVNANPGSGAQAQAFTSWKSGLAAVVATLKGDTGNAQLVAELRQGNASIAQLDAAQSLGSWATGEEPHISQLGSSTPFTYGGPQGETPGAPAVSGFKSGSRGVLGDIGYTLLHPYQTGEQAGTDIANASGLSNSDIEGDVSSGLRGALGGVTSWIEKGAADVTFVGFGLLLVLLGVTIAFKSEGEEVAPAVAAAAA